MTTLSKQEQAICQQMGVTPDEFQKTKQAEKGPGSEESVRERVRKLMGISQEEAEKSEREQKLMDEATTPLSEDELDVCRALGVDPLDYYHTRLKEAERQSR